MSDNCPHCHKDMKLDSDFLYENNMYSDGEQGEFNCPQCDETVYWAAHASIEHTFETDKDFL